MYIYAIIRSIELEIHQIPNLKNLPKSCDFFLLSFEFSYFLIINNKINYFMCLFLRLMRKAMREPLFIEFVDECLKIIEPTSQQLSDKQVGQ